jgi:hypothetical protein
MTNNFLPRRIDELPYDRVPVAWFGQMYCNERFHVCQIYCERFHGEINVLLTLFILYQKIICHCDSQSALQIKVNFIKNGTVASDGAAKCWTRFQDLTEVLTQVSTKWFICSHGGVVHEAEWFTLFNFALHRF